MSYPTIAPQLVKLGYDPTPTKGKVPALIGWQTRPAAALNFDLHQGMNVGIVLGGEDNLIAIDVDVPFEPACSIITDYIKEHLPLMPERVGSHPKTMFLCRTKKPRKKVKSTVHNQVDKETGEITVDSNGKPIGIAVEILAEGQQAIGYGTHPDTGKPYEWVGDSLLDIPIDQLPIVTGHQLDKLMAFVEETLADQFSEPNDVCKSTAPGNTPKVTRDPGINPPLEQVEEAMAYISPDGYDIWIKVGMALYNTYGDEPEILAVWTAWSEGSTSNEATGTNSCGEKWNTFNDPSASTKPVTVGTIAYYAREGGWTDHFISNDISRAIDELNKQYAVVLMGGAKTVILREFQDDEGNPQITFMALDAFKQWLENRTILHKGKKKKLAIIWLSSPYRRQYEGVTFSPKGTTENYFNLWRGFTVEPSEAGSCDLFLKHIKMIICNGNEKLFHWVIGWFAQMVQEPHVKIGTSLVVRGKQGSGKTVVGSAIGELFGKHYVQVASARYITGQFNSHLSQAILLHCDEGFWAGDKNAEGQLKDLVTGEHQLIEFKGKDPIRLRNLVRLFITSNNDWVVPAGFEERRFCVLDASDGRMQDSVYFKAVFDQLENGGYEALLHYLLEFDLKSVNLRQIPETKALQDQKINSFDPIQSWWYECLINGSHDCPNAYVDNSWDTVVKKHELLISYQTHAKELGKRYTSSGIQLGKALTKMVPGLQTRKHTFAENNENLTHRKPVYILQELDYCRDSFDKLMGTKTEWHRGGL